jgi:hypothetical protein
VRLYADRPGRRARQLVGDLLTIAWVLGWVGVGRAVHAAVLRLAEPGRTLESAGRSLEGGLREAAAGVGRTPLLGERLREPLDAAGDAAQRLAAAGVDAQTAVGRAALLAAVAVAAWPALLGAAAWVVHRVRWARRAGVVRRTLLRDDGLDLLALRALAVAPLDRIATVGADPAAGWRRGDPDTVRALAELALRDVGVRAPASSTRVPPGVRA